MEFTVFEIVQIVIDTLLAVAISGSLWYCAPKLKSYRRMVQLMTAESRETATDPKLIAEWASKRDKLVKGCPKWKAYHRRLKAEGYEE